MFLSRLTRTLSRVNRRGPLLVGSTGPLFEAFTVRPHTKLPQQQKRTLMTDEAFAESIVPKTLSKIDATIEGLVGARAKLDEAFAESKVPETVSEIDATIEELVGARAKLVETLMGARTSSEIDEAIRALGLVEDPTTLTLVMIALYRADQAERALGIFDEAFTDDNVVRDTSHGIRIRGFLHRSDDWNPEDPAFEGWESTKLDLDAFNAAISTCVVESQFQRALQYYEKMLDFSIKPDLDTYNTLIRACDKSQQWERALELFDQMRQKDGVQPDAATYDAVISACVRNQQWERAIELYDQMQSLDLKPDNPTYSNVMLACGAVSPLSSPKAEERTFELLAEMRKRGLAPRFLHKATTNFREENNEDPHKLPTGVYLRLTFLKTDGTDNYMTHRTVFISDQFDEHFSSRHYAKGIVKNFNNMLKDRGL